MNVLRRASMDDSNDQSHLSINLPITSGTCFWLFPREIRDIIYGYLLSMSHTGSLSVIVPYRGPRALDTAILEISRRAFDEVIEFINKQTTVQLTIKFSWSDRDMHLLRTARRLHIHYDANG
jgi:hypothetical protein